MECEYCKKTFATKGNLTFHQKSAKYCLKLREEINDVNFTCDFCNINFNRKSTLTTHLTNCKEKINYTYKIQNELLTNKNKELEIKVIKYEQNLENLNEKIKDRDKLLNEKEEFINKLQDQIKELAQSAIEKPTNNFNTVNQDQRQTNNNNNNNSIKNIDNRTINMIPFDLTPESFRETLENKFNETYLMKGQKGIAEFMLENVLITGEKDEKKYKMKCTDPSRKVFISLDEKGNIVKDVNADNLTRMISGPVKEVSHKLFQQIQDRYFQVYENVGNELEEDDEESKVLSLENERMDYATNRVVEISKLKNNNTEFVKGLIPPLSS